MKTISEYASKLVPNSVIYWILIKVWAYGTSGKYGMTDANLVTMDKIFHRYVNDNIPKME